MYKKFLGVIILCALYACSTTGGRQRMFQVSQSPIVATESTNYPTLSSSAATSANSYDKILYRIANQGIFMSTLDGSSTQHLLMDTPHLQGVISKNGRDLAYAASDGILFVMDISSRQSTQITSENDFRVERGLAWSPDGKKLAYSCMPNDIQLLQLCIMDMETKEVRVMVNSGDYGANSYPDGIMSPSWSSDGTKILFSIMKSPPPALSKTVSTNDIMLIDMTTGKIETIFANGQEEIIFLGSAVFLPGGNSILFSGRKGDFNAIYQINIDGTQLKQLTPATYQFDITDIFINMGGTAFLSRSPMGGVKDAPYVPTLFSMTGEILQQYNLPTDAIIFSWIQVKGD